MSFTCSELKELCNKYIELQENYAAQQEDLVEDVLRTVSTYHPLLSKVCAIVAELDVLVSFA
jgi:DNA mismatch repair ATPase MutS